ncbi:conserved hypothetical protein [Chloroherpeton thalassium ATCC 35110]|uniref:Uncharacterized protein n=1 Tax=Chloroherpeton thalassium (strain ATCC 35110 / GB-78) TaxID=517418 RepID=B3QTE1_CHLT3|nr:hypothetical protein [Chloroherpeton thalassium]ACF12687.1 conserved hypothetical protein [Chloroherpeton thalassium ATCC 35110]
MTLEQLLNEKAPFLIEEALQALSRAHLKHYEEEGAAKRKAQMQALYELTAESIKMRDLSKLLDYVQEAATSYYKDGFDLHEIQMAFNVLEEVVWKNALKELPASQYADALGLISTALGAGKDTLATTYVNLASSRKMPSLDLSELFTGTEGRN